MKVDVPAGGFERAVKKFMRLVKTEGIRRDVMDREAFTPPGEERRIKRRRAIKRRRRADDKMRELDTLTAAPLTYVEKSLERLKRSRTE
jgi:ribosomal protein S21